MKNEATTYWEKMIREEVTHHKMPEEVSVLLDMGDALRDVLSYSNTMKTCGTGMWMDAGNPIQDIEVLYQGKPFVVSIRGVEEGTF